MRCRFCVRTFAQCSTIHTETMKDWLVLAAFILLACAARWAFTKSMVVSPTWKATCNSELKL